MHENLVNEITENCLLMRTRLISRVFTAIYDEELRPLGIKSPQLVLLAVVSKIEPATRAEIGRYHHQDRSTLTRNLKIMLSEGWVEEIQGEVRGRSRPIVLTKPGKDLLRNSAPAWRVAQARTKALLRKNGVIAVRDLADRIMNPRPTA